MGGARARRSWLCVSVSCPWRPGMRTGEGEVAGSWVGGGVSAGSLSPNGSPLHHAGEETARHWRAAPGSSSSKPLPAPGRIGYGRGHRDPAPEGLAANAETTGKGEDSDWVDLRSPARADLLPLCVKRGSPDPQRRTGPSRHPERHHKTTRHVKRGIELLGIGAGHAACPPA